MMAVSLGLGISAAAILIAIVSFLTGGSTLPTNALDGTHLRALTLPGLASGEVHAPWATGHPTVVVFFASWCAPCTTELPRVDAWLAHHDLGRIRVMGIDTNDEVGSGEIMAEDDHVTYPVGFDAQGLVMTGTFGFSGPPDTVFVSSSGVVTNVIIGSITNSELAQGVAAIS
jgi:thiol-disulfide isomerase/thioredoxin